MNRNKLIEALARAYGTKENKNKTMDPVLLEAMVEELTKALPDATTKILIGCPTFGLDRDPSRWLNSLLIVCLDLIRLDIPFGFLFPYRQTIHAAENRILTSAITGKYTHVLRMDDDVWGVQPGDIQKLLKADKEFISAVMFIRGFPYSRCAFRKRPPFRDRTLLECEKIGRQALEEVDGDGVLPVDLTAFPFTLIKTSIFDRMTYPYFDSEKPESPDAQFCQKCADLGIQPYVHMDVQVNHENVTPWNRLALFNADARRLLMQRLLDPTDPMYKPLVELFGEDGCKDLYILKGTGREPKILLNEDPADE